MKIRYLTSIILVSINLYPLYGIFYLGFQYRDILFIYLIETIIVLFFTLIKLYFLKNKNKSNYKEIFWACIVFNFFGFMVATSNMYFKSINEALNSSNLLAILLIFISHTNSFFSNYIFNKEYERLNYSRITGSYITKSLSLFIIMFGSNLYIYLVIFKTLLDLMVHNNEHKEEIKVM